METKITDQQNQNPPEPMVKIQRNWLPFMYGAVIVVVLAVVLVLVYFSFKGKHTPVVKQPLQQLVANEPSVQSNTEKLLAKSKIVFPKIMSERVIVFSALPQTIQVLSNNTSVNSTSTAITYSDGRKGYRVEFGTTSSLFDSSQSVTQFVSRNNATILYGARAIYFLVYEFTLGKQNFQFTQTAYPDHMRIIIQTIE